MHISVEAKATMHFNEIETARLRLRPFHPKDLEAVHRLFSDPQTTRYLLHGVRTKAQTAGYIRDVMEPVLTAERLLLHLAITLPDTGVIGAVSVTGTGYRTAELAWILHWAHTGRGYATEAAAALLDLVFENDLLDQVSAHADARNQASLRLMERLGMEQESYVSRGRPWALAGESQPGDEIGFRLERNIWLSRRHLARSLGWPVHFDHFIPFPDQRAGELTLSCVEMRPAKPERGLVPTYFFDILRGDTAVGHTNLRIGYSEGLFYGGQIGYDIKPEWRGRGYAGQALVLLAPLARAHGMEHLLITNDVRNHASRRVCEKLGLRLLCIARVPEWTEIYLDGVREVNVFDWDLGAAGTDRKKG
ncbi:MAG: GNAT family N-acetyltransferase [Bacillota bacterium]|nr:GNAT family N-acetyltransferase [Bacillota bacterium]